jgi:hypothetical protein
VGLQTGDSDSPVVREDKGKRHDWITNTSTKHHVYSFFEGVNANQRVTKIRGDGEGNPPVKMWGLVADYDARQSEEFVLKIARSLPVPPNWIERSLSSNWRYIWLFAEPVRLPSHEFTCHFLKKFDTFGFPVESGMIGFDKGAWLDPSRLFTNSGDWRRVNELPIPKDTVQGWLVQASQSFEWTATEIGPEIPLEVAKAELEKKFPRFSEWPGEFVLNSQGPTFWIEQSRSPKSAIVRETGIQTFADHAHKAFFTWSDLLGCEFVKQYESAALGRAVEGIYFDGKHYFRKIANESWRPFERSDIALHLKAERKVRPRPDKTGVSKVEHCIAYIQTHQSVVGAAPFAMRPSGLIHENNSEFLNTSTRTALASATEPSVWGETGQFPWISKFLDAFFDPHEQLEIFLSWLSFFYQAVWHQEPRSGQNIFIAGNPNVGKTLLGTRIIATLVGGFAEAKEYLLGDDKFGSELFEVPLWCVDDATFTAEPKTRRHFSEMIKRMAANRTFRYHAKFRIPLMVQWQGRVIVTCNRDEQSIQMLPDLENSILDKIMYFKAADKTVDFPAPAELEAILQRELPFFARFLLDYQIPEQCKGDARFGVKAYHEASLVQTAEQSSLTAEFSEILEEWKNWFFDIEENKEKKFWEGTAYQLKKSISFDPQDATALRGYGRGGVGRALASLKNKGAPIQCRHEKSKCIWRIYRPGTEPNELANSNTANGKTSDVCPESALATTGVQ